jgi:hypothetical protein
VEYLRRYGTMRDQKISPGPSFSKRGIFTEPAVKGSKDGSKVTSTEKAQRQ